MEENFQFKDNTNRIGLQNFQIDLMWSFHNGKMQDPQNAESTS